MRTEEDNLHGKHRLPRTKYIDAYFPLQIDIGMIDFVNAKHLRTYRDPPLMSSLIAPSHWTSLHHYNHPITRAVPNHNQAGCHHSPPCEALFCARTFLLPLNTLLSYKNNGTFERILLGYLKFEFIDSSFPV